MYLNARSNLSFGMMAEPLRGDWIGVLHAAARSLVLVAGCALLLMLSVPVQAQLRIEIVDGVEGAVPIAIVPFGWESVSPEPAETVSRIVSADLQRSGLFQTMAERDMIDRPVRPAEVRFGTWRLLKVDYVVTGRVIDAADGLGLDFEYHLVDVHSGRTLLSQALAVGPGALRFGAHRVADAIYQAITGTPGAFATRIAYVVVTGTPGQDELFELVVADADGFNPQTIVRNDQPLLSPAWSPDGRQIAFVSFATGRSNIVIQDVFTGQNRTLSSERGINGAPAFSPDGRFLAMSLSRTGSPEIWVTELATGRQQQLTDHWSINTEPAWSPDGRHIYFTSDRAGRPQVYRMARDGSAVERVTHEGRYNSRASVDPSGRLIAVVHGRENVFQIALHDRETGRLRVLSDGRLDESPSFAPNGSMVLFATREGERGVLAAISADGRVRQRLVMSQGDVREPAWSPMSR